MRIRGFVSVVNNSDMPTTTTETMKTIQKSQRHPMVWESQLPITGPIVGPEMVRKTATGLKGFV